MNNNSTLHLLPLAAAMLIAPCAASAQADGGDNWPLAIVAEGTTVAQGTEATLTATVVGGTAPYTLTWLNGLHEQVGTTQLTEEGTSTVGYTPTECDDYYVTATDAAGQAVSDTCRVVVTGEAVAATMENLWLDDESQWAGPDTKGDLVLGTWYDMQLAGSFVSGSYAFSNNYSLDYGSWSGFAYSNHTATNYETLADQYNSVVGSGADGSKTYAVAYNEGTISVLNSEQGDTLRGMYIAGNAYANTSILTGDAYSQPFTTGSWLAVNFTGQRADGTTATLTTYLADYQSENEADHYVLDSWQWVDLRPLGQVTSVSFFIDGSDKSYGYLNTPAYFCLDNVNGERATATAATQTSRTVSLSQLFTLQDNGATVTYALPDAPYDGTEGMATITDDGTLTLADNASGDITIVVSATQQGKTQYVAVPFSVTTAISQIGATDNAAKQIYDMGGRRLDTMQPGINIVRMADGTVKKVVVK